MQAAQAAKQWPGCGQVRLCKVKPTWFDQINLKSPPRAHYIDKWRGCHQASEWPQTGDQRVQCVWMFSILWGKYVPLPLDYYIQILLYSHHIFIYIICEIARSIDRGLERQRWRRERSCMYMHHPEKVYDCVGSLLILAYGDSRWTVCFGLRSAPVLIEKSAWSSRDVKVCSLVKTSLGPVTRPDSRCWPSNASV